MLPRNTHGEIESLKRRASFNKAKIENLERRVLFNANLAANALREKDSLKAIAKKLYESLDDMVRYLDHNNKETDVSEFARVVLDEYKKGE